MLFEGTDTIRKEIDNNILGDYNLTSLKDTGILIKDIKIRKQLSSGKLDLNADFLQKTNVEIYNIQDLPKTEL